MCGRQPADAHHLRFAQPRTLGRKVSDEFTVPVCRTHHREIHRTTKEREWWLQLGIDPLPVADRLWAQTRHFALLDPVSRIPRGRCTMTSIRQIEANRRNAEKSTGPRTEAGKQRSSLNALRHGLTAETVVLPLEDEEDYQAFEEAVLAGFDAETAVERELVLRLAALLWRLRRVGSIETGLFQLATDEPADDRPSTVHHLHTHQADMQHPESMRYVPSEDARSVIAGRFLNILNWNTALERMSRYELALWRQVRQTLFILDVRGGRRILQRQNTRNRWSSIFAHPKMDTDLSRKDDERF